MAQEYLTTIYKETGFDDMNRPSSREVLEQCSHEDVSSVFLRQTYTQAQVKIAADWAGAKSIDYLRIGNRAAYYLVTNVRMLNDKTALLDLEIDPLLTSGGLQALTVLGGWTKRSHVGVGEDTLFGNTLAEPFTPSSPIKMDGPNLIKTYKYAQNLGHDYVLSTVDLGKITDTAKTYIDSTTGNYVSVPEIPVRPKDTIFRIRFGATSGSTADWYSYEYAYPMGALYVDYDNSAAGANVIEAIKSVRSLGIENAIVDAYRLPADAVGAVDWGTNGYNGDGRVEALTGQCVLQNPALPFRFTIANWTVKNLKVFSGLNKYVIYAQSSGDRMEFDAHDIWSGNTGDTTPFFWAYTDVSPNGKPYLQPQYFHRNLTAIHQQSIGGATWLRQALAYTEGSGAALNNAMIERTQRQKFLGIPSAVESVLNMDAPVANSGWLATGSGMAAGAVTGAVTGAAAGSVIPVAGTAAGAVLGGIGGAFSSGSAIRSLFGGRQNERLQGLQQQYMVAPEVAFANDPAVQGYLGNAFYIYRLRYSDNDAIRFDHFLTQYGYAQDKLFVKTDLKNRAYFNYIKTEQAQVRSTDTSATGQDPDIKPYRLNVLVEDLFNRGVRLWHVPVNSNYFIDNPAKDWNGEY